MRTCFVFVVVAVGELMEEGVVEKEEEEEEEEEEVDLCCLYSHCRTSSTVGGNFEYSNNCAGKPLELQTGNS